MMAATVIEALPITANFGGDREFSFSRFQAFRNLRSTPAPDNGIETVEDFLQFLAVIGSLREAESPGNR
jgi:hypothetical protein